MSALLFLWCPIEFRMESINWLNRVTMSQTTIAAIDSPHPEMINDNRIFIVFQIQKMIINLLFEIVLILLELL